jgi:cell division protein ZapA
MADVQLNIAGRAYVVTCNDGEESHLEQLGAAVNAKAEEAGGGAGGLNESRLLLFSALLLADELHELKSKTASHTSPADVPAPQIAVTDRDAENMAGALERLADRIEKLAAGLE